ncbi:MAG: hypothetical protein ACJ8AD_14805 [Gemmatimonadaceae bacterium]
MAVNVAAAFLDETQRSSTAEAVRIYNERRMLAGLPEVWNSDDVWGFALMLNALAPIRVNTVRALEKLQERTAPIEPGHPGDPDGGSTDDTEEERALPDADAARPFLNLAGRR